MQFENIKKNLIFSLLAGFAIIVVILLYGDVKQIVIALKHFDFKYLGVILCIMPFNFFIRFLKYNYYFNFMEFNMSMRDKIIIFLSGLCMSITPAKVGEIVRPYMIKVKYNIPMSRSLPLLVAERVSDAFGMLILSVIGLFSFKKGVLSIATVLLILLLLVMIVHNKKACYFLIEKASKIKFLKKHICKFKNFYESSYVLFETKSLIVGIVTGVFAWGCEALVIFITARAFGEYLSIFNAFFIIGFSALVGGASMLPGGIGVTDGSILGLLKLCGFSNTLSVSITLFSRFSTLWLGVMVGMVAMFISDKNGFLQRKT
ncbi:MAG: lysylphosphatidylglycerol synthase transmembrane domain-containing protein [Lachnospiraceae bacterium]|nr:lysylphosphatidylglycerol synthase transmembrane domain-containing protein [Lachnospiraceae bacterium]